ncbi:MAG: hypothetical protein H6P99_1109 [Holophagaceae bacterium]|nr:hypothetical protein [Holophagaceae bacterium]
MPPGNLHARPPVKVIEKRSIEACLAIASRVQLSHERTGDLPGSLAAAQVADLIRTELLRQEGT